MLQRRSRYRRNNGEVFHPLLARADEVIEWDGAHSLRRSAARRRGFGWLGESALATYLDGTTTSFECSHMGHSKVRRLNPGASGTIRATTISVPHSGPITDSDKSKPRHP
jgi:hypothetical protein